MLTLFLISIFQINHAATYETTADAKWHVSATWVGGSAPLKTISASDVIIINHDLTSKDNLTIEGFITIEANGTLDLGKKNSR
jgi:hypothetical protein